MENKTKIKSKLISFWTGFRTIKKSYLYAISSFLILTFGFDVSFAADSVDKVVNGTVIAGDSVVAILGALLGVLTSAVSLFLNPGWINGEIFGLTKPLKDLWILVSNVVYFIFAGILIVIAFMNIVGKGGDKFELKQALPKFIVGILIVPFSWFIVQFILSISAILTVSVLTIPYDTFPEMKTTPAFSDPIICKNRMLVLQSSSTGTLQNSIDSNQSNDIYNLNDKSNLGKNFLCGSEKISLNDFLSGDNGGSQNLYGIISIYSFGVLNLQSLDELKGKDLGVITKLLDLGVKVLFDLLFIIIYVILMVALFLALFIRGVWLWLYAMLSPLFGLMYFLGDKGGETLKKFNFKELFALAMVPVYVSAALSFGLLFLYVAGKGMVANTNNSNSTNQIITDKGIKVGPITIEILGTGAGASSGKSGDGDKTFLDLLLGGTGSLIGKLILQVFGLALLWIAVMAALNASNVTKSIVEPIEKFGKSVGSLAMSAPKYIPIPGTGGLSAQGLSQVGQTAVSNFEQRSNLKTQDWLKQHNLFQDTADLQKSINKFTATINSATTDVARASALKDILRSQDPRMLANNSEFIEKLKSIELYKNSTKDLKVGDYDGFAKTIAEIQKVNENGGTLYNGLNIIGDGIKPEGNYNMQQLIRDLKESSSNDVGGTVNNNSFDFKVTNQGTDVKIRAEQYISQMKNSGINMTMEKIKEELKSAGEVKDVDAILNEMESLSKKEEYKGLIIEENKK
nr:hypothetical protein [Candidatus Gracilibacteria bacterium]